MEMLWRLILGHLIGDFTLQTNYIAAWKRKNLTGMLVHCGIHPVIYSILLWNYMGQAWVQVGPLALTGWGCVFIIFAAHFVEDQWRVSSVIKRSTTDNTIFYLWDQIVHYTVLFAMAPVIAGSIKKAGWLEYPPIGDTFSLSLSQGLSPWERFLTVTTPEPWVMLAILFVVVTHFTTVTIYFLEKDSFGRDFPGDAEKYIGMTERLVLACAVLLPGWWWVLVAGSWVAYAVVGKIRKTCASSWINLVLGTTTALVCGFLARCIIYS